MDETAKGKFRPPVVTLMGHVDHGKTTLLDAIRKTNIAKGEHGGITQHIGAYQIEFSGNKITFIDTPGHAAFEKMRFRGAEIADIVILVVAATEGVKPQTIEAIKHIKKLNKPVIVAATKIDLPGKNIEKLKSELQKQEIVIESYGGDVPLVEVSATENQGVNDLLEIINLIWQISPKPSLPNKPMEAVVVESFIDKNKGPVATLIINCGTLKVGQKIQIEGDTISIRALIDDYGKNVKEAEPGKPVEVLGFKKVLDIGTTVLEQNQIKVDEEVKQVNFEDIVAKAEEVKDKFKTIIKADVLGSLEAILGNLPERVLVLMSGVGEITSTDVNFAKIAKAPILAFNIRIPTDVKNQADREKVVIREYRVIYDLLTEIEAVADSFAQAKQEAKITGRAKIVTTFEIEGKKIAGATVTFGKIKIGDHIIVKNGGGEASKEAEIVSLKKYKKDVPSVLSGQECGIAMKPEIDFSEGYIIESLG